MTIDATDGRGSEGSERTDNMTVFGTSMATLFAGFFFVLCAWYLGPYPDFTLRGLVVPIDSIVGWLFYGIAAVCIVFSVGFWGVAMREAPEMATFFKAFWGGGEEGWRYASQSAVFLGIAAFLHLVFVTALGASGLIAWIVQFPILFAAFFGMVMLAFACDSFFVKPTIRSVAGNKNDTRTYVENVRKRATVAIPILIALIALLVEILK